MKKKTVVMLLALSLTLAGCGNAETTKADVPVTQTREQTQQEELKTQEQQMSELSESDIVEETQQSETGIQASAIETAEGEFDMRILVHTIGDGEIVYYSTPKKTNFDVQNVEDIDKQEKVLLYPLAITDPKTYMRVGMIGGGTKKIHEIGITDNGLTLIETEQGNFFVDTEMLSEFSYNSETESLLTQEKLLDHLKEIVEIHGIIMSDTKEGFELLKSDFSFIRREGISNNDNRAGNLCMEVIDKGGKEIYFDIVEEISTHFYFDVYYK